MSTWLVIVAVGLGSFVLRLAPLLALERVRLGPRVERLVANAGTAAITALIATSTREAASGRVPVAVVAAVLVGGVLAARRWTMPKILLAGGGVYAGLALVAAVAWQ